MIAVCTGLFAGLFVGFALAALLFCNRESNPFDEGRSAFRNQLGRKSNPYRESLYYSSSIPRARWNYNQWDRGWCSEFTRSRDDYATKNGGSLEE